MKISKLLLIFSLLPSIGLAGPSTNIWNFGNKQPVFNLNTSNHYSALKHNGYALDWCMTFARDCGKPVADQFCRSKGHKKAKNWKQSTPGTQTMTLQQNSICDPSHTRCDSFKFIQCEPKQQAFYNPKHNGYRMDWCRTFSNECGKPAAVAFCKSKGFQTAVSHKQAYNTGKQTMTIGQNSICDPRHTRCDGFKKIVCE